MVSPHSENIARGNTEYLSLLWIFRLIYLRPTYFCNEYLISMLAMNISFLCYEYLIFQLWISHFFAMNISFHLSLTNISLQWRYHFFNSDQYIPVLIISFHLSQYSCSVYFCSFITDQYSCSEYFISFITDQYFCSEYYCSFISDQHIPPMNIYVYLSLTYIFLLWISHFIYL